MNGIINIYKPSGLTSHTVVSKIKRFTGIKRVGHSGTLDPMAKGVLPVLVGNAASVQELITGHDKIYRAGILFGKITDTADITGNVIKEQPVTFTKSDLDAVIKSFIGVNLQTPPMYSALKVNGQKLCDLARKGIEIERKAREITIYDIKTVTEFDGTRIDIDVSCSKGTYIRTLAEDIGNALGCGACLDSLERLQCGIYKANEAIHLDTLEELYEKNDIDGIEALLKSPKELFSSLKAVTLPDFFVRLSLNGAEIYLKKIKCPEDVFLSSNMCRLLDSSGDFYAVGELRDYPDGKAIKIKYRFV